MKELMRKTMKGGGKVDHHPNRRWKLVNYSAYKADNERMIYQEAKEKRKDKIKGCWSGMESNKSWNRNSNLSFWFVGEILLSNPIIALVCGTARSNATARRLSQCALSTLKNIINQQECKKKRRHYKLVKVDGNSCFFRAELCAKLRKYTRVAQFGFARERISYVRKSILEICACKINSHNKKYV